MTTDEQRAAKREYDKLYYQRNKERILAQNNEWKWKNYEKSLAISRKSKDKRRFGGLREEVLCRDDHKCVVCKNTRSRSVVVHHKDETNNRRMGNANNTADNLVTLCRSCHRSVHNGTMKI